MGSDDTPSCALFPSRANYICRDDGSGFHSNPHNDKAYIYGVQILSPVCLKSFLQIQCVSKFKNPRVLFLIYYRTRPLSKSGQVSELSGENSNQEEYLGSNLSFRDASAVCQLGEGDVSSTTSVEYITHSLELNRVKVSAFQSSPPSQRDRSFVLLTVIVHLSLTPWLTLSLLSEHQAPSVPTSFKISFPTKDH